MLIFTCLTDNIENKYKDMEKVIDNNNEIKPSIYHEVKENNGHKRFIQ